MKEIGSSFYLEDCVENSFSGMTIPLQLYKKHTEFFSSCRDALRVILNVEHISDGSIMVPPFTCHAVLQPFLERGLSIKPYSIKYDLSIDVENTIRIINHTKPIVFVYHTYFGFFDQGIDRIITVLRERNTIVIEDRTQNMFSKEGKEQADYVVGSIRKWLGIPDGGFLNTNKRIKTLSNNRFDSFVDASVKAMEMKYRYLRFGEGSDRDVVEVDIRTDPNEERREVWVDARDLQKTYVIGTTTHTYSDAEYRELLIQRGLDKLAQFGMVETVNSNVDPSANLVYGVDYDLGDLCTYRYNDVNIEMSKRITEVTETIEGSRRTLALTFGIDKASDIRQVIKRET